MGKWNLFKSKKIKNLRSEGFIELKLKGNHARGFVGFHVEQKHWASQKVQNAEWFSKERMAWVQENPKQWSEGGKGTRNGRLNSEMTEWNRREERRMTESDCGQTSFCNLTINCLSRPVYLGN